MPDEDIELMLNDEILLCGTKSESRYTKWQTRNIELLENNIFEKCHTIPLLRWLKRRERNQIKAIQETEKNTINLINQKKTEANNIEAQD